MFIYEVGNSLNLTFKGSVPVTDPEIVLKGYQNGVSLTVNGEELVSVADAVEFEQKAKTLVYQKSGKLFITFHGITGMSNPEVEIDELENGLYSVVIGENRLTLSITDTDVSVVSDTATVEEPQPANIEPEPEVEVTDETEEEELTDPEEE